MRDRVEILLVAGLSLIFLLLFIGEVVKGAEHNCVEIGEPICIDLENGLILCNYPTYNRCNRPVNVQFTIGEGHKDLLITSN